VKISDGERRYIFRMIYDRLEELTGIKVEVLYLHIDPKAGSIWVDNDQMTLVEMELGFGRTDVLRGSIFIDNDRANLSYKGPIVFLLDGINHEILKAARVINKEMGKEESDED